MKKPLLATGLSGMVGTRFIQLFHESYEFENIDLTTGVDITDTNQVMKAIEASSAEVVIHLAAFTNVSQAYTENGNKEGICYRVNVTGTENMAKAVKKCGKHLIHVSTDFVFDGTKETAYVEEDEPHPIEWYGQTKWWAEEKVMENLDDYTILRLAYPYQAFPVRPDFIQNMADKLRTGTLPPAFTDHTITPTFVDDLSHVFDYFATHKLTGLFHATGSSWHTDYEIANLVRDIFQIDSPVPKGSLADYLAKNPRPYQKTMMISNEKLRTTTGLTIHTLPEGLAETYRQQKDQQ